MSLQVKINNFSSNFLARSGKHDIHANKMDIILSGLICGRFWLSAGANWSQWATSSGIATPHSDTPNYSRDELTELYGRAWMLNAYLHQSQNSSPIETTGFLHQLEKTEKGYASNWIGVAVAQKLAESLLGIPVLFHVKTIERQIGITATPGVDKPDYFGYSHRSGTYAAIEAKGRTETSMGKSDIRRFKQQAQSITAVRGISVEPCVLSVALLGDGTDKRLKALFIDPKPTDEGHTLEIQYPELLEVLHYGPLIRAVEADSKTQDISLKGHPGKLKAFRLGESGYLGASEEVMRAINNYLKKPSRESRQAFSKDIQEIHSPKSTLPTRAASMQTDVNGIKHDVSIGLDGIALILPSTVVRAPTL